MAEYQIVKNDITKKLAPMKEFIDITGVGKSKAYDFAHMEGAPVIFIGNRIYFIRSKIDEFIESLAGKQL